MTELQALLRELCHAGRHPEETIRASMAETGKPAVGCFPLFVPEELVYAAGFLPVGLWGGTGTFQRSNRYIQSFACSILRADLELGLAGKYDFLRAVLIPTQCDTLKCVCEDFKAAVPQVPVIGVTIPHNRTIQAAHGQLLDEFDYLTASLRAVQTPDCRPMRRRPCAPQARSRPAWPGRRPSRSMRNTAPRSGPSSTSCRTIW